MSESTTGHIHPDGGVNDLTTAQDAALVGACDSVGGTYVAGDFKALFNNLTAQQKAAFALLVAYIAAQ